MLPTTGKSLQKNLCIRGDFVGQWRYVHIILKIKEDDLNDSEDICIYSNVECLYVFN